MSDSGLGAALKGLEELNHTSLFAAPLVAPNSTYIPEELCPWTERRLPLELKVKLLIIHITVFISYSHLLHLRAEKRSVMHFVFLVAAPIYGVNLAILPIVALCIQAILCRFDRERMAQTIGVLIGELGNPQEETRQDRPIEWPPNITWTRCRAMAAQCIPLCQCVTSIWLFVRRFRHGSAALYDYRVLQLALLGLGSSFMALVHVILQPRCLHRYWSDGRNRNIGWLELFRPIATSRDPRNERLPQGEEDLRAIRWAWDLVSVLIVAWLAYGVGVPFIKSDLIDVLWAGISPKEMVRYVASHWYYYLALLGLLVLQFRKQLMRLSWQEKVGLLVLIVLLPPVLVAAIVAATYVGITFAAGMTGTFTMLIQLFTLLDRPDHWEKYDTAVYRGNDLWSAVTPDWDRIWTYGHIGSTFPCPMAWKDSAADYVWAIA